MKRTADVVIAGGGCMGCSVAWHLAQRGITNVVLLEREPQLGAGSTGKNAGGFRHQFSNSANIELSIESIALMTRFEEIVGTPIDFHQDGYLFLLSKAANVETFKKNVALQQKHGVDVRWVSNDEARELSPGLDLTGVKGATYCPSDGVADPNGVTMGFAKGAQAKGVEIVRECEVTGAKLTGHRLTEVRTSKGDISTPIFVNAAGPWAKSIGRLLGVDVPVEPERRHIFIASPPGGGSWDDAAQSPAACRQSKILVIDFESTFYFHREGGGLLFGMGDPDEQPGFDITVRWDFLPKVIEVAMQRLPALVGRGGLARVGGTLRDDARSQSDHRTVERRRRLLHDRRLQRPRLPALAGGRTHPRRRDRRPRSEVRSDAVRAGSLRPQADVGRSQRRLIRRKADITGRT